MGVNVQIDSLYKQVERDYNARKLVLIDHVAVDDTTEVSDITPESNPSPTKSDEPLREVVPARKKCGRPKGSTNENAHKDRNTSAWQQSQENMPLS